MAQVVTSVPLYISYYPIITRSKKTQAICSEKGKKQHIFWNVKIILVIFLSTNWKVCVLDKKNNVLQVEKINQSYVSLHVNSLYHPVNVLFLCGWSAKHIHSPAVSRRALPDSNVSPRCRSIPIKYYPKKFLDPL